MPGKTNKRQLDVVDPEEQTGKAHDRRFINCLSRTPAINYV